MILFSYNNIWECKVNNSLSFLRFSNLPDCKEIRFGSWTFTNTVDKKLVTDVLTDISQLFEKNGKNLLSFYLLI